MEAASRDEEVEDEVKRKIDEALACTCVDDLKDGPCGDSFVEAFSCFIRSQHKSLEVRRNLKKLFSCIEPAASSTIVAVGPNDGNLTRSNATRAN